MTRTAGRVGGCTKWSLITAHGTRIPQIEVFTLEQVATCSTNTNLNTNQRSGEISTSMLWSNTTGVSTRDTSRPLKSGIVYNLKRIILEGQYIQDARDDEYVVLMIQRSKWGPQKVDTVDLAKLFFKISKF